MLVDERLQITRWPGSPKARKYVQLDGLSPNFQLGIYNGDINTLACGLLERMFFCKVKGEFVSPPQVSSKTIASTLNYFRSAVLKRCGRPPRLTLEEVVETYTGRKRTTYQNALNSLAVDPVKRKDARSKAFVKVEKGVLGKAPRPIQPRDPRYNLVVAKYIKPLEPAIFKAIARVFGDGPTVMKGYNVRQIGGIIRGKWESFRKPCGIGIDAVKFDMHVCLEMLEYEHGFYTNVYSQAELKKLLKWQIHNRGIGYCSNGKLRYQVKGRRFSGDMNTSLGNCIIMCALVHAYSKHKGIHTKLINNGDDCVVFMESGDADAFMVGFTAWFMQFGFRMTVEKPVYEIEHIEFCQMHPIWTPSGYVMVRNVDKSLAKDSMALVSVNNEKSARTWLKAIGQCGASAAPGIPILQEFYQLFDRQSNRTSKIMNSAQMLGGFFMLSRGMEQCTRVIDPGTRVSFMTAFGYTPDEQRAYEDKLRKFEICYDVLPPDTTIPNHFTI